MAIPAPYFPSRSLRRPITNCSAQPHLRQRDHGGAQRLSGGSTPLRHRTFGEGPKPPRTSRGSFLKSYGQLPWRKPPSQAALRLRHVNGQRKDLTGQPPSYLPEPAAAPTRLRVNARVSEFGHDWATSRRPPSIPGWLSRTVGTPSDKHQTSTSPSSVPQYSSDGAWICMHKTSLRQTLKATLVQVDMHQMIT